MYHVKFYTEALGWFSTAYFDTWYGIPFVSIAREIQLNIKHWEQPITYKVFSQTQDITTIYEDWVNRNS